MTSDIANDAARRAWARWVGILLVATNVTAALGLFTRGGFILRGDPALTAAAIGAGETLFRAALVFELVTVAGLVPLIVGLYRVLKPVAPGLAALGLMWRTIECAILALITFASFTALALLGGAGFMRTLGAGAANDLVYALLRVHGSGYQVAFLFLGLGQWVFSLLWWRSALVPRALAGLGLLGSSVMVAMAVGIILWPGLYARVTMAYMAPMGLYEIGLGLWLAVRGIAGPRE